jgi:deoxyribose-phosphate aldolase
MALGSDAEVARLAISLLDLTDLADDTTSAAAANLCERARRARVAAVCVWPQFVTLCSDTLHGSGVRIATVVNFPSGEESIGEVLDTTSRALVDGADEIDVVLPYRAWLRGDTHVAADVLDGVRDLSSSGNPMATVKVIIETGELPDRAAIDRASHFVIARGADFVKTSTGKTPVSATLEAAEVIIEAIDVSGKPVGFKASGGIRTLDDARSYLELAATLMGEEWISPTTFRFGASSLLDALLAVT